MYRARQSNISTEQEQRRNSQPGRPLNMHINFLRPAGSLATGHSGLEGL